MKKVIVAVLMLLLGLFVFGEIEQGGTYKGTVEGMGKYGDPWLSLEGKRVYVKDASDVAVGDKIKFNVTKLGDRAIQAAFVEKLSAQSKAPVLKKTAGSAALPDDVYEVGGIGSKGNAFVFIDKKITFITNMTGDDVVKGELIQIENLKERGRVNFAEGEKYDPKAAVKKPVATPAANPKDVYPVTAVGSKGDPIVKMDGKITFVTNLSSQEAPIGTKVKLLEVKEGAKVNFAQGQLYTPGTKSDKAASIPTGKHIQTKKVDLKVEVGQVDKAVKEGDIIDVKITETSKSGAGIGFYGSTMIMVSDTNPGQNVKVEVLRVDDKVAYGTISK